MINLNFISQTSEAKSFSAIVWYRNELTIIEDSKLNIKNIFNDLKNLEVKLLYCLKEFEQQQLSLNDISNEVSKSLDEKINILNSIQNIELDIYPKIANLVSLNQRRGIVAIESKSNITNVQKVEKTANMISSGNFISVAGLNIVSEFISDAEGCKYIIKKKIPDGNLLTSSDNSVYINYDDNFKIYTVTGKTLDLTKIIKAGNGINVTIVDQKFVSFSLKPDILLGKECINVQNINNLSYIISLDDNLLTCNNGGFDIQRLINGSYAIDLSVEAKDKLDLKYKFGFGIVNKGKVLSADTTVLPKILASSGIDVSINSIKPDNYHFSINLDTVELPKSSVVESGDSILNIETNINKRTLEHTVSLNKRFTDDIINDIANLQNLALDLKFKSENMLLDSFSETLQKSLLCPIFKVFKLVTNEFEESGLVTENFDPTLARLLKVYGPGTHQITVNENMLPYLAYSEMGSGTILGIENSIDLYIPLQQKIREAIGDPNFFISDGQKESSNFRIVDIDTEHLSYSAKARSELPKMSYNMEYSLKVMHEWSVSDWGADSFKFDKCNTVPLCNQNPTVPVNEQKVESLVFYTGKGDPFNIKTVFEGPSPFYGKPLDDEFYLLFVQDELGKASGDCWYLMEGTVDIPETGKYTFKVFADDEFQLYINCLNVKNGNYAYSSFDLDLTKGRKKFICRYKNIPNLTPGYFGFNIYNFETGERVYQSRAEGWLGQRNAVSDVSLTSGGTEYPIDNWVSTKYENMPLMVTGGDADYIIGLARANQKNDVPLEFPEDLSPDEKIHLISVDKVENASSITYTMVIKDDYTNAEYTSKFTRLVGRENIDMFEDYITEDEGFDNPGHVRLFGRLYANWVLPDNDLNRMIYVLGRNFGCLANVVSKVAGSTFNAEYFPTDYLSTVSYTENMQFSVELDESKINMATGEGKLKIDLTSGTVGYSQFPIDSMISSIKFGITYEFTLNPSSLYNTEKLFDDCCWPEIKPSNISDLDCSSLSLGWEGNLFYNPEDKFNIASIRHTSEKDILP